MVFFRQLSQYLFSFRNVRRPLATAMCALIGSKPRMPGMKTSAIIRSNAPSFNAMSRSRSRRECNPEFVLLEPYASGCACRHQSSRCDAWLPPCSVWGRYRRSPARQGRSGIRSPAVFLRFESERHRISVANRRAVCPAQGIRSVRSPRAATPGISNLTGYRAPRRCRGNAFKLLSSLRAASHPSYRLL